MCAGKGEEIKKQSQESKCEGKLELKYDKNLNTFRYDYRWPEWSCKNANMRVISLFTLVYFTKNLSPENDIQFVNCVSPG